MVNHKSKKSRSLKKHGTRQHGTRKQGTRKQGDTKMEKKHGLGSSGIRIISVGRENVDEANNLMMNKHAMVEFFHPQCGHCKALEPTWKQMCFEIKKNYKGDAVIAAVDCSQQDVLNRLHIDKKFRAFPTISHMHHGKHQHEFEDERTKDKLLEYAESKLPIMRQVERDLETVVEPMLTPSIMVRPSAVGPDFIGPEVAKAMKKTGKKSTKGKRKSKRKTVRKTAGKRGKKTKQSGGYRYRKNNKN